MESCETPAILEYMYFPIICVSEKRIFSQFPRKYVPRDEMEFRETRCLNEKKIIYNI